MPAKKKKTAKKPSVAAVITIRGPGKMTPEGRAEIAAWLRRHAKMLMKDGPKYTTGTFTGRYFY